eukprot:EG_transcript_29050
MKVIFLDIDGVLHPTTGNQFFLDSCMEQLKQLVEESGAVLCLSSSWRCSATRIDDVNANLQRKGIPGIFSCTPYAYGHRPAEILTWLMGHPEVTHFTVIDDMNLSEEAALHGHIVQTRGDIGLTADLVRVALAQLGVQRDVDHTMEIS